MSKFVVKEIVEGGVIQSQNEFDSFEDLKAHLVATDYFGWISENEPEKELPNFEEVETVSDIESIFEEYDYSYWAMTIEEINMGDKLTGLGWEKTEEGFTKAFRMDHLPKHQRTLYPYYNEELTQYLVYNINLEEKTAEWVIYNDGENPADQPFTSDDFDGVIEAIEDGGLNDMHWLERVLSKYGITRYRLEQEGGPLQQTTKSIIDRDTKVEKMNVGTLHKIVVGITNANIEADYSDVWFEIMDYIGGSNE